MHTDPVSDPFPIVFLIVGSTGGQFFQKGNGGKIGGRFDSKPFSPSEHKREDIKMNDTPNIPDSANVSSGVPVEKLMALYDRIIARIPRGVDWWNRGETLKYISRSEHIFLLLSSFFAGCENHGTLYIDSWGGYQIRDYMMEAGVVKCADVFTKLYPLTIAKQELDEIHDQLDQDEMDDRYEIINSQMKKIEMQMPSEDYDEIQGLLWKFAQKHGLDMLLPPDENGRK